MIISGPRDLNCAGLGTCDKPMVWIGLYIAVASFFCILAMAADLLHGLRSKKFWFPCKYFSLNAASITVITITMKLPVDLSSEMPDYMAQAARLGSLAFMCTMMANIMPSLASMDNKTLLANVIGLCILVVTVIVNICIETYTMAIGGTEDEKGSRNKLQQYVSFPIVAWIYTAMMLLLLLIMISSSLTIPTSKEILDSKYQATNKTSVTYQDTQMLENLRQSVRRYWVMAESGSPQFIMASNPLSTASGIICVLSLLMNLRLVVLSPLILAGWFRVVMDRQPPFEYPYQYQSAYKWSTTAIFLTQSIGVFVGTIAPISRCFSGFSFNVANKWSWSTFFKVEKYWIQKLNDWKQKPVRFPSSSQRSRRLIYNSKNIILSLCIGFQRKIVISCKVMWLIVIIVPIFVVRCFTPPIDSRTIRKDDLSDYVLQINNDTKLAEKTLKGISKSMNSFILKAEKEQNDNLLELLEKSTGFEGVQIFDTDNVQSLLPDQELVNGWSLPIVTLTCIAVALPNISEKEVKSLLRSVGEGLSFTYLVEENLNSANEYVNIQKTTLILWHEVENKWKWLNSPHSEKVFKGKKATEIVGWFSDKAKQMVREIKKNNDGGLVENPPHMLIAANSMYRITQTLLLRYQNNIEPITKKRLFGHLKGMIADIFSACFTNIPRVIAMRCDESVIEKREASVRVAAKLLGKTTKIIERVEARKATCFVREMDDEKMAYIDAWRLYMKQSIP